MPSSPSRHQVTLALCLCPGQLAVFASITYVILRAGETDQFQAQFQAAVLQVSSTTTSLRIRHPQSWTSKWRLLTQVEAAAISGVRTRNAAVVSVADYIQSSLTGFPPNLTMVKDGGQAWQEFTQTGLQIAQARRHRSRLLQGLPPLTLPRLTRAEVALFIFLLTLPARSRHLPPYRRLQIRNIVMEPVIPRPDLAGFNAFARASWPTLIGRQNVTAATNGWNNVVRPPPHPPPPPHSLYTPLRTPVLACRGGAARARPSIGSTPERQKVASQPSLPNHSSAPPPPSPHPAQHNLGVWEYVGRSTVQLPVAQSAGGPRPFYVANLQPGPVGPATRNENSMLYDVYSEEWRRIAMDGAMEQGAAFSSDFVQLVPDGPMVDGKITRASSLMFAPVFHDDVFADRPPPPPERGFPKNAAGRTVIAFASCFFSWDALFTDALPRFISGIDMVMETSRGVSFTFALDRGQARERSRTRAVQQAAATPSPLGAVLHFLCDVPPTDCSRRPPASPAGDQRRGGLPAQEGVDGHILPVFQIGGEPGVPGSFRVLDGDHLPAG